MTETQSGETASQPEPPIQSIQELEHYIEAYKADPVLFETLVERGVGDSKEESGLDKLRLHLRFLRDRAYPNDTVDWNTYPQGIKHRAQMQQIQAGGNGSRISPNVNFWHFVGPINLQANGDPWSGRVNTVAYDPANPNTYYLGAADGGLWKTVDGGTTWFPLSNGWPFEAVSSIAIDPKNSKNIYVGTGDFQAWSPHQTFGLMKSIDGGATFTNLAVAEAGSKSISKIIIDSENPNIVVMTCGRGRDRFGHVLRSIDAGQTWSSVVPVDAEWADVEMSAMDASGNRWYYAVGWNSSGGLLYRSSDRGATWTQLQPPWKPGQFGIAVAASPLHSNNVYVLAGADNKVLSSSDAGNSWIDITGDLTQNPWDWNQLWYDWYLKCSFVQKAAGPAVDVLYVGLKHLFRSDSPNLWKIVPTLHDDQHDVAINPQDPNQLLIADDGGVWSLVYTPSTDQWNSHSLNATLGITQFYKGAFSSTNPNVMQGAAQDNGTDVAQGDLNNWKVIGLARSGDSTASVINPVNDSIQFASIGVQYYGIFRTDNQWNTQTEITPPPKPDDIVPGDFTPLALDSSGSRLLWGTNFLWVWDDTTKTWNGHVGNQKLSTSTVIRAIAVAPSDSNRVYTGSGDGEVWMASNSSWNWTQINTGQVSLPNRSVTSISVNPNDPDDILVGLGGGGTAHIWRCSPASASSRTWVDVSGTGTNALPDMIVNAIARDDGDPANVFYVATDIGVFYTDTAGAMWNDLTIPYGLPSVRVTDLAVVRGFLHAVTFGRGIWRESFKTNLAPAAVGAGNNVEFFAVLPDGRIFYNYAQFGQGLQGWKEVDGGGRTDAAPAAGAIGTYVYVVAKGPDGNLALNQGEVGGGFVGWQLMGFKTNLAPAAVGAGNNVEFFAVHPDGRIFYNYAQFGQGLQGWKEVDGGGRTDAAPAAGAIGTYVYVVAKGPDGNLALNQGEVGGGFVGWQLMGFKTNLAPAAVGAGNNVEFFAVHPDGRIFYNYAQFGQGLQGWNEVPGDFRTDAAPAAGAIGTYVYVAIKSPDGNLWLNQGEVGGGFVGWQLMK